MSEWVLILAAGESKRFNGIKALAPWRSGTMLSNAVQTGLATGSSVLVVTGAHHATIAPILTVPQVYNADWSNGMGSSLAVGAKAILDQDEAASMITVLPVDQPFVTPAHLHALAGAAKAKRCCIFTRSNGISGPPAAVPQEFFASLLSLHADEGLKSIFTGERSFVDDDSALLDIDTKTDWTALSRHRRPVC